MSILTRADLADDIPRPVVRALDARRDSRGRSRLDRLAAMVLLDGTVRRTPFSQSLDRSLLELPIDSHQILLDLWREQLQSLCGDVLSRPLPCRIVVGHATRLPALRRQDQQAGMTVETDPAELRGTGGVLRDIAEEYGEDDVLLVANAAKVLVRSLSQVVSEAAERGGDVTVVANGDGTPSSLALMSCRALRRLSPVGFVDLKEQGLPLMAKHCEVTILNRATACGLPIRTPADYLAAVRGYHRMVAGQVPHDQPFDERWQRHFALVERGAVVSPDATLHDCVVLRGAQVGSEALVAQSIVCTGATVLRRGSVIRHLVGAQLRVAIDSETT